MPRTYTVGAVDEIADTFGAAGAYDLSVYGPNGFWRGFAGGVGLQHVESERDSVTDPAIGALHAHLAFIV